MICSGSNTNKLLYKSELLHVEDKREENKETRQDRRQRNRRSARYKEQTQDERCGDREKVETDQNKDRGRVLDRCFDFLKKMSS